MSDPRRKFVPASQLERVESAPQHTPRWRQGDRVRLASGGPVMLVADLAGDDVTCAWEGGEAVFPAVCLRAA